ncbi:unnamed protein product [Victoria cruziana]
MCFSRTTWCCQWGRSTIAGVEAGCFLDEGGGAVVGCSRLHPVARGAPVGDVKEDTREKGASIRVVKPAVETGFTGSQERLLLPCSSA